MLLFSSSKNFLYTAYERWNALSPLCQQKQLKEFCRKTKWFFYFQYFAISMCICIPAIFSFILLLLYKKQSKIRNYSLAFILLLFVISISVLSLHPLWTKNYLKFKVPEELIDMDMKIRSKKFFKKQNFIKNINKFVTIPFIFSLITSISLLFVLHFFIFRKHYSKPYLSYLYLFMLPGVFLAIGLILQIVDLFSSWYFLLVRNYDWWEE